MFTITKENEAALLLFVNSGFPRKTIFAYK